MAQDKECQMFFKKSICTMCNRVCQSFTQCHLLYPDGQYGMSDVGKEDRRHRL